MLAIIIFIEVSFFIQKVPTLFRQARLITIIIITLAIEWANLFITIDLEKLMTSIQVAFSPIQSPLVIVGFMIRDYNFTKSMYYGA